MCWHVHSKSGGPPKRSDRNDEIHKKKHQKPGWGSPYFKTHNLDTRMLVATWCEHHHEVATPEIYRLFEDDSLWVTERCVELSRNSWGLGVAVISSAYGIEDSQTQALVNSEIFLGCSKLFKFCGLWTVSKFRSIFIVMDLSALGSPCVLGSHLPAFSLRRSFGFSGAPAPGRVLRGASKDLQPGCGSQLSARPAGAQERCVGFFLGTQGPLFRS